MSATLSDLTGVSYADLTTAFNQIFADYSLTSERKDETWLRNRLIKNAYSAECSVGAYIEGRLVGYMLNGVADWRGDRIGFAAAVGIVPRYRGQGIAGQMFAFVEPHLREHSVQHHLLEVVATNQPAVDAYEKAGFAISREFACFELALPRERPGGPSDPGLFVMGKEALEPFEDQRSWVPSWENSFASIRRIPDQVFIMAAIEDNRPAGLLVYYPTLNWLMSIIVRREYRGRGVGNRLMQELLRRLPASHERIRALNCPRDDKGLIGFFERLGFVEFASQYEMTRAL